MWNNYTAMLDGGTGSTMHLMSRVGTTPIMPTWHQRARRTVFGLT